MRRVIGAGVLGLALLLPCTLSSTSFGAEIEQLLVKIKAVRREGVGNRDASRAAQELARHGPDVLITIFNAFDGADATTANWLRASVDTIAERALKVGKTLPATDLERFVLDRGHSGAARSLAYQWLVRVDAKAPARLLPGMTEDPSPELRRDALALLIAQGQRLADTSDRQAACAVYRKALAGACDRDQVDLLAKRLKELGVEVDLAAHFGFIREWRLIGPFDNHDGVGFQKVFAPERRADPMASIQGKNDLPLHWQEQGTKDSHGLVDLNKALGKHMGAVAYAFATVSSPTEQPAELRAGSNNAIKMFVNGKQVFFREEYHHGIKMDQHIGPATLKAGPNEILVKVCQNEQTEDWAQSWSFQLRICDSLGRSLPLQTVNQRTAIAPKRSEVMR